MTRALLLLTVLLLFLSVFRLGQMERREALLRGGLEAALLPAALFREVLRVLRPDGTVWLNVGDGGAGAGKRLTYEVLTA